MNNKTNNLNNYGFREDFDPKNKIVRQEDVEQNGNMYFVSTIDLGLDYRFGSGPPLYFETMIFNAGSFKELYCQRYSTKEEALRGHEELIKKIKNNEYIIEEYKLCERQLF